jgi:hypothetical protein
MFKYRLHWADGSDAGQAEYAVQPGETIIASDPGRIRRLRVLDLVPVDDEESSFVGLLRVEAA